MHDEEARSIAALRAGDLTGLEALVRLYQVSALGVAANICRGDRQMAEDVVADAFLAAYRSIHTFDPNRPFLPWFCRIVIRAARSAMKQRTRVQTVDDIGLLREDEAPVPGPELQAVAQEQRESLLRLIDALPIKQREVIVLRYYQDMDERTTSGILGVPVGTVKWRLFQARKRLHRQMSEQDAIHRPLAAEGERP